MAIDGVIPAQRYEQIRDRIATILVTEFDSQYVLSEGSTPQPNIYTERMVTFGLPEMPALNIVLSKAAYDNKDSQSVDGLYTFAIECYAAEKTNGKTRGDYSAAAMVHRILGMVRAILENPIYETLNYAAPYLVTTRVEGITPMPPSNAHETSFEYQAVLHFFVRVPEDVILLDAVPLLLSSTVVKLYNTGVGYLWSTESAPPPEFIITEEEDEVVYFIAE